MQLQGAQEPPAWREILGPYMRPSIPRSVLDLATSLVPYVLLTALIAHLVPRSVPLALLLAVPAGGFLLRTYIIFHDCAHASFLPTKRGNVWLGRALGLLVYSDFD